MSAQFFRSGVFSRAVLFSFIFALFAFSACSEDDAPSPTDGDGGTTKNDTIVQRDAAIAALLADDATLALTGRAYNVMAKTASIPVRFNASAEHLQSAQLVILLTTSPTKKLELGEGCTEVYIKPDWLDDKGMAIIYVTGLVPSSSYRYAVYYRYSSYELALGSELTFETSDAIEVSVDAVDLGLSVKWGSWNLGAARSYQEGRYYKYGLPASWNTEDSGNPATTDIAGTPADPATYELGDGWQSPTQKQILELINKCTWQQGTDQGVAGYYVYGKGDYQYNYIFIPFAGYESASGSLTDSGKAFMLWSGQFDSNGKAVTLKSSSDGTVTASRASVKLRVPIRPVYTR